MSENSVASKAEKGIQNEPKQNKRTYFHRATFALKAEYWNALNNLSG